MNTTLEKVNTKDIHILKNLYSLYLHDLSKFTENLDIGIDGSYHFDDLEILWEEEGFSPYFIKHADDTIGFLLLLERPFLKRENEFGVNDIFILNKFRGKGFGKQALEKLFKDKPGKYFVVELWKKVYKQLNIEFGERKEFIDDEPCLVQTFTI